MLPFKTLQNEAVIVELIDQELNSRTSLNWVLLIIKIGYKGLDGIYCSIFLDALFAL